MAKNENGKPYAAAFFWGVTGIVTLFAFPPLGIACIALSIWCLRQGA